MTGRKASLYWRFCWAFITPVFMTFIFIYSMVNMEPIKYSGWDYPTYLVAIGWGIFGFGFMLFPAFAAFALYTRRRGSVAATIRAAFVPTDTWGPADQKHFVAWKQFKTDALQIREKCAADGNHSWIRQKWCIFLGLYPTVRH